MAMQMHTNHCAAEQTYKDYVPSVTMEKGKVTQKVLSALKPHKISVLFLPTAGSESRTPCKSGKLPQGM